MNERNASRTITRPVVAADFAAIAEIYNYYIRETVVTFEEVEVDGAEMQARAADSLEAGLPWLAAVEAGRVVGYAYATRWKNRAAYRDAVETSIYLAPDACGRGVGARLYAALFEEISRLEKHVVIGGVALPNPASVALHERFGMKKVAHFVETGFKFGRRIDVGYWEARIAELKTGGAERSRRAPTHDE